MDLVFFFFGDENQGRVGGFAGFSRTALGYGDVVLPKPWSSLGPMCAMNGFLAIGCSTAALFLVLEMVYHHRL